MAAPGLPAQLIGLYQDAFMKSVELECTLVFLLDTLVFSALKVVFHGRKAGPDGSVDSSKVSIIMKTIGQNPSEAEIQVGN